MIYHIYTGLIIDKFNEDNKCPLCAIRKVIEEQFLTEFLNDAVMDDSVRTQVNKLGFCCDHFEKLFARPNKLSVALQTSTRLNTLTKGIEKSTVKSQINMLEKEKNSCIICDLTKESMAKYYMTIAYMFKTDSGFAKTLANSKGFCLEHYKELLKYSSHAGSLKKEYIEILRNLELERLYETQENLKTFCDKHDYRNRTKPLGNAETALPDAKEVFYGINEKV